MIKPLRSMEYINKEFVPPEVIPNYECVGDKNTTCCQGVNKMIDTLNIYNKEIALNRWLADQESYAKKLHNEWETISGNFAFLLSETPGSGKNVILPNGVIYNGIVLGDLLKFDGVYTQCMTCSPKDCPALHKKFIQYGDPEEYCTSSANSAYYNRSGKYEFDEEAWKNVKQTSSCTFGFYQGTCKRTRDTALTDLKNSLDYKNIEPNIYYERTTPSKVEIANQCCSIDISNIVANNGSVSFNNIINSCQQNITKNGENTQTTKTTSAPTGPTTTTTTSAPTTASVSSSNTTFYIIIGVIAGIIVLALLFLLLK